MKKFIALTLICLLSVAVAQTALAQDVTQLPAGERGTETVIGVETYSKANYTGWLALEVTVKDGDTKQPLAGVIVSLINVKTGEHSGTGPAVDEPNPPGFFPQFGKKAPQMPQMALSPRALSNLLQPKQAPPPVNGSNGQFMTDDNGQIVFRMYPSPDQYRIEVKKSGYADYVSDPFELRSHGQTQVLLKRPEPEQPFPVKDTIENQAAQGNGPKTGDTQDMMPYVIILAAAAGAIVVLVIWRKRRKDGEQRDEGNEKDKM